MGYNHLILKLQ